MSVTRNKLSTLTKALNCTWVEHKTVLFIVLMFERITTLWRCPDDSTLTPSENSVIISWLPGGRKWERDTKHSATNPFVRCFNESDFTLAAGSSAFPCIPPGSRSKIPLQFCHYQPSTGSSYRLLGQHSIHRWERLQRNPLPIHLEIRKKELNVVICGLFIYFFNIFINNIYITFTIRTNNAYNTLECKKREKQKIQLHSLLDR